MPVPADGWTVFLGLWGAASVAVATLFALVMRGTGPAPTRGVEDEVCECLGCLHLRRSA